MIEWREGECQSRGLTGPWTLTITAKLRANSTMSGKAMVLVISDKLFGGYGFGSEFWVELFVWAQFFFLQIISNLEPRDVCDFRGKMRVKINVSCDVVFRCGSFLNFCDIRNLGRRYARSLIRSVSRRVVSCRVMLPTLGSMKTMNASLIPTALFFS